MSHSSSRVQAWRWSVELPGPPLLAAGVNLDPARRKWLWAVTSVIRMVHCPLHGTARNRSANPPLRVSEGSLGAPLTVYRDALCREIVGEEAPRPALRSSIATQDESFATQEKVVARIEASASHEDDSLLRRSSFGCEGWMLRRGL